MTIKDLIKELKKYPDNIEIICRNEYGNYCNFDDYDVGLDILEKKGEYIAVVSIC